MSALTKASAVLRRRTVWIPTAAVLVLALGYGAALAYVGGGVPRGTSVRGVDIGGMSPAAAEQKLTEQLGPSNERPLKLAIGGRTHSIDPHSADLVFDAEATVEAAGERSANPVRLGAQLAGSSVEPVVRVDEAKLKRVVAKLADRVDRPVREGSVHYEGTDPVATLPRAGRVLDQDATADRIRAAFPTDQPIRLELQVKRPNSTAEAVRDVARDEARTAVSAPVELSTGKTTLEVSPRALARRTEFVPDAAGALEPSVDGAKLAKDLGDSLAKLETEPKEAEFELKGGKPRVVPSKQGRMVERKKLGATVASVLDETDDRAVDAPVTKAKPKMSTKDAKKLRIDEKVGSFTTKHQCCQPRVTNIHQAADILDGQLVKPGKVFSLNEALGQRTRAKGFVPAPMILDGRHVDSVGGGVSQIATTTFNAMFFAGLQDVAHKPHSYYISRYPLGREATVSWGQPDLKFKNDSKNGILITTSYTDTSITVTMWGTKRYDIDATAPKKSNYRQPKTIRDDSQDCTPESPSVGYDVSYSRVFKQNGEVVRTEPFRTVYLAAPRVICEKDKKKSD